MANEAESPVAAEPEPVDETQPSNERRREGNKFLLLVVVFSKISKFFKLFKASAIIVKFAKVWITIATMAISVVVYAFAFGGWWFALGLVGMLLIHELGHVWAMRRRG